MGTRGLGPRSAAEARGPLGRQRGHGRSCRRGGCGARESRAGPEPHLYLRGDLPDSHSSRRWPSDPSRRPRPPPPPRPDANDRRLHAVDVVRDWRDDSLRLALVKWVTDLRMVRAALQKLDHAWDAHDDLSGQFAADDGYEADQ